MISFPLNNRQEPACGLVVRQQTLNFIEREELGQTPPLLFSLSHIYCSGNIYEAAFPEYRAPTPYALRRQVNQHWHLQAAGRWPCDAAQVESRWRPPGRFERPWGSLQGGLRVPGRTL